MKKIRTLDGVSHIVLIAAILVAASVIVMVHYNEYRNITKSISSTASTEELDKKITTVKFSLQQMIINQRGYLLLGKKKYRDKFFSYYSTFDSYIIDVSRSMTDDESDKLIKSLNSNVFELKLMLRERIIEKDKSVSTKFLDRADNQKMLDLYEASTDELEQLAWIVWSKYQVNIKNTAEAYSHYSSSILISSLMSVVILAILVAMLIISQKRTDKTRSELTDVNQRLNILLQATSDGVLDWDVKNNKLIISPKFKKLLGYEDDQLKSDFDSIFKLIHPDDKLSTWVYASKIITPEQPIFNQLFRMKHCDGSWSWISSKGIGFFDKSGEMERFVGVHIDVTLQKNLENILKYSKDKAEIEGKQKSDFLAYMSHEIRSPIGAVVSLTKILSETSPLTDDQRKYLDALKTGADTIYGLLNNILDLSKLDAHAIKFEKIEFNLQQLIADTAAIYEFPAREKNIKLTSYIPVEANTIFLGDPHRIKQILTNLLSNAVKFTEKGRIEVSARMYHDGDSEKVKTEITVADTGIGIEKNKLTNIFDAYVQGTDDISRKYGGTGLGLSISRQFAELMGGKIDVESEKDKGSKFKVTLILERAAKIRSSSKKIVKPKFGADNKVLIVEDYAPNAVVAETVIENLGYSCVSVATAKEAIMELSSKAGKHIGIVLMDVQLPDMSGFDATKLIRKMEEDNAQPPRRIIAMTAHDLLGDKEKCIRAGMDDYISKPFDPAELAEKLKKPSKIKVAG